MSKLHIAENAKCNEDPCSSLKLIIESRSKDIGGFEVRRMLPQREASSVGPWIFFDHMGPAEFAAGTGIDVRPHPHINLATVTYLFEGEIYHRDSLGSSQPISPGDINLMVAGKGIVHSERESPEVHNRDHKLDGLQLWMALPEEDEEIEPAFHHYPAADLPRHSVDGVDVRVMIGEGWGIKSPVRTFFETFYAEALLLPGQSLAFDGSTEEIAVYVLEGEVQIGSASVGAYSMAVMKENARAAVSSASGARIALVGGEKIPRRYMEWNFVSSSKERIAQAKKDWKERKFPLVQGDEEEFIPLPE